jgi:hypothetical protein
MAATLTGSSAGTAMLASLTLIGIVHHFSSLAGQP